ncbi:MAG: hypothetical protein M3Y87_15360 [Myxococcota bacterium]|nr:hypothetical protein [Myxococcota bacterium]
MRSSVLLAPVFRSVAILSLALLMLAGCGGAGDVGAGCERPGSVEECVDGAVCATNEAGDGMSGDPVWDTYSCRVICDEQSDCNTGEECRGVTGAAMISACQPTRTR